MNRIFNFINEKLTGRVVIISGVLFGIVYTLMNTIFPYIFETLASNSLYLESLVFYSPESLYKLINAYGTKGISAYIRCSIPYDFLFPIISSFFFMIASIYILKNFRIHSLQRVLFYLANLVWILDWIENILLIIILNIYPLKNQVLPYISSACTIVKSFLFTGFSVFIVVGLIIIVMKKIKIRKGEEL